MSEIAIRSESLSKQYRIGQHERYKALRDVITDGAASPFRRLRSALGRSNGSSIRDPQSETRNTFWALENVSFEINRGEVVGIIGRNGAGKSTLLKILSRITKPTRGHAEIRGRVGSLLEVGTGFHPELTGRENIYLNAAILGMRRADVERKFDEIVAFAEVEKFIDTPVKRYSSGMYVRLAFAVAAHMETEVLLVDEVLAVGDAQFQKKCLCKMGEVATEGRTIIFVSHNLAAVESLCGRSILFFQGSVELDGDTRTVIEAYLQDREIGTNQGVTNLWVHPNRHAGSQPILSYVKTVNSFGDPITSLFAGDDLILEFELLPSEPVREPSLGIGIDNSLGQRVFSVLTYFSECHWEKLDRRTVARCVIPRINLVPGRYAMNLSVGNPYNPLIDAISSAACFTVESSDYFQTGRLPTPDLGVVLVRSHWEFSEMEQEAE
jgi:homopolymeric O-antigen transport system ATP-binding protein